MTAAPFDHSFTLQAIMEMQKGLGGLTAKIDRLSDDIKGLGARVDGFGDKLDGVKRWQHVVSGGAIVVAAVGAIIWAVITFIPWNRVHIDTSPPAAQTPKS